MEWMASEEKDGSVNSSVAQAIDSSASLEIDQPTESSMSSGKKVFFFKGRLICGPDPKGLILAAIAISLSSWTFAVHVASDIRNPAIIVTSSILTTIVLVNLVYVSTIDPGIIPRNDLGTIDAGKRRRRSRVVVINGIEVKLKYCNICNIYRPPRTCHCATCNNCIQQFDHHCTWIGHCVGLRNYRLHVTFLLTGLLLFAFIFIFSCKSLHHKLPGDGNGVIGLLRNDPETVALTLFSFVAMCFLAGFSCYHVYLIAINQTSYEHFHQKYVSSGNPYDKGILNNIKEALLASQPPSRVNFRADVEPGWFGGLSDISIK
ncbi:probable protein S-acyltransferase 7 isoform X2 [Coffea arabica]|uniref:S-acyltransferase n=1 Tax=Coffea arabica TaxID=13443 RepID=A0ABM4UG73_COFAR